MKKLCLIFTLLFTVLAAQSYNPFNPGMLLRLDLRVQIINPRPGGSPFPRSPICPPTVEMYDHTLYFEADHPTYTLVLVDEDGEEAYEVTIPSTMEEVELPSTLVGEYELQLYDGGEFYFYCDIELE